MPVPVEARVEAGVQTVEVDPGEDACRWFKGLDALAQEARSDASSDFASSHASPPPASLSSSDSSTDSDSDSDSSAQPQRVASDDDAEGPVDGMGRAVRSREVSDEELLQPKEKKPAISAPAAADYSDLF